VTFRIVDDGDANGVEQEEAELAEQEELWAEAETWAQRSGEERAEPEA
jgi:hypothetical protein